MDRVFLEYMGLDRFDPDLEYDYDPLKSAVIRDWETGNDRQSLAKVLDKLADVAEIDNPQLAKIYSESFQAGNGRDIPDERLAKIWQHIAEGSFDDVYNLVTTDVDTAAGIKEMIRVHQILSFSGDLRSTRLLVQVCDLYSTLLNNFCRDMGPGPIMNEAAHYAVQSVILAEKLQDSETQQGCSDAAREAWFNAEQIAKYRELEASAWYNRGRAYRFKYKEDDENNSFRGAAITSMKKAAALGHEKAQYYFPGLLMRKATEEQLREAINYARDSVLADPEKYAVTGDEIGKDTSDVSIGSDVVCMTAHFYGEGLGGYAKDGNKSHELFEAAAKHGSEWGVDALGHFKKKMFGGWEFQG